MADENIVPEVETSATPEVKADPFEAKALELGWRPKEEWDGPDEEFIDAKEFVRRKPLFEKIEHQSKSIKQLTQAFEALKTHHTKVKESEYQRALKSLKEARRIAMADGETERALAYEEKIEEVEAQKAEFDKDVDQVQIPTEPQEHPTFVAWREKNGWYGRDEDLTAFADGLGPRLARNGLSPEEVLREITKRAVDQFPAKFRNPNRDRAGGVEAPSRKTPAPDTFSMSQEERDVMKKFVKSGVMTEAQYIKELKQLKGL